MEDTFAAPPPPDIAPCTYAQPSLNHHRHHHEAGISIAAAQHKNQQGICKTHVHLPLTLNNSLRTNTRKRCFPWTLNILLAILCALLVLCASIVPTSASASVIPARNCSSYQDAPNTRLLEYRSTLPPAQDTLVARAPLDPCSTHNLDSHIRIEHLVNLSHDEILALLQQHLRNEQSYFPRAVYQKREEKKLSTGTTVAYAVVIPVLVVLSGIFAGLTIGYMSLDETQLQVLAITGTEKQREHARKIIPVRKDGHLLLTTLLIANMITNETLPIVSDPLFPTPVLAVIVSTILVIVFSELVPQSICSRYGLEIGAYMAVPTRVVMFCLWPVAFPISRVLHWTLGPHHGIIYRRAELKELVTMHASTGGRGGDLKRDTVMMVGGALDLQEKVVEQAMTPIDKVFMLPFDARLDYPTLQRIVRSGHSRIPIYQEVEAKVESTPSGTNTPSKRGVKILNALTRRNMSHGQKQTGTTSTLAETVNEKDTTGAVSVPVNASPKPSAGAIGTIKRKNIIGTLLVKSCVLLDPEDAVPVSDMTINALPTVPSDEPLHNVLNAFQEGRSHMAIVTSMSRLEVAQDVSSSMLIKPRNKVYKGAGGSPLPRLHALSGINEESQLETSRRASASSGDGTARNTDIDLDDNENSNKLHRFWRKHFSHEASLEQQAPSNTMLPDDILTGDEKGHMPPRGEIMGIITLEDVLEELIGEEIYDEYDPHEGDESNAWNNVTPPLSPQEALQITNGTTAKEQQMVGSNAVILPAPTLGEVSKSSPPASAQSKTLLGRLGFTGRSRGAGGSSSPVPSRDNGALPPSTPVPLSASPELKEPAQDVVNDRSVKLPTASDSDVKDYFTAHAAISPLAASPAPQYSELQPISRSLSVHNEPFLSILPMGVSASSRPTTPSGNSVHPQPNRPVVLRKSVIGGGMQNIIVGENMLRGRNLAPGVPVVSVPATGYSPGVGVPASGVDAADAGLLAAGGAVGSSVRSLTPKPKRFKSTPVQQQQGIKISSSSAAAAFGACSRSASVEPPSGDRASCGATGASWQERQPRAHTLATNVTAGDEVEQQELQQAGSTAVPKAEDKDSAVAVASPLTATNGSPSFATNERTA